MPKTNTWYQPTAPTCHAWGNTGGESSLAAPSRRDPNRQSCSSSLHTHAVSRQPVVMEPPFTLGALDDSRGGRRDRGLGRRGSEHAGALVWTSPVVLHRILDQAPGGIAGA